MSVRLVLALVAAGLAWGQTRSQLAGFVRDSSGAGVADAAITVINLGNGVRRAARTNDQGLYAISSLTPGSYKITVRKPGFQTVAHTGVPLRGLDSGRIDFLLEIGSLHEEITVASVPPLVNVNDASLGIQVGSAPAEALPLNGRGLQAMIDLAPGVLTTPATAGEAGQFSANGQRPATNYFTVDGVSANNGVSGSGLPGQFSGAALPAMTAIGSLHNLLSLAELDELRVQTSTYAPEFGRLPGAQVAVSTRSGSNAFHGQLFGSTRHEALGANDWFANAAGMPRAAQRFTNVGGMVGGPVRRNQTFFVLSSEYLRLRQPVVSRIAVPSLGARAGAPSFARAFLDAFPMPNGAELGAGAAMHTARFVTPSEVTTTSARVDQALGASGTLFVRYNRAPSSNRFGYLQTNEASFESQSVTAGVVTVLGARLTNDARIGVSSTSVTSRWMLGAASVDLRSLLPSPGEGQRLYGVGIRGVGQILAGDEGRSRQGLWNWNDTLSFTTGRHDVRVGVDYQRLTPRRDQAIASVVLLSDSIAQLASGLFPGYTFAQTGGGASLVENFSAFAQDTWHVTPRWNVTYGVRWELTPAPSYRGPAPPPTSVNTGLFPFVPNLPENVSAAPVWNTRWTQVAPRVGAAYRLNQEGTRVLRAGAGLFYDLGFSSAIDLVNGAPFNRWRGTVGLAGPAGDMTQYGFDRDLRLPRIAQWNVTVEQALTRDSAVSIGYVGAAGRQLLRREAQPLQFARLVLATNHGTSSYHSMQAHYRSRDYRGLQGTVSYTWAHAIDNGSWDSATWLLYGDGDRASSNFDVRHSFQAALSYAVGRWRLSGAFRARTGFPVDVITNEHPFGLGFDNEQRPDLVPGVPLWIGRELNPAVFRTPPAGRQGSLGRNALRGNGLAQLDLALTREFAVSERGRVEFRVEAYNVSNRVNFGDPVRVMSSPLFGRAVSMTNLMLGAGRPNGGLTPAFQSGGPRVLQAGFTFRF